MEPIEETREPQHLYAPSRSSLGTAGLRTAPGNRQEPWTTDGWNPAGQEPEYSVIQRGPLLSRVIALAVIAIANLALLTHSHLLENLVVLLDLLGVSILFDLLLRIWRDVRRTRLRWTTLPVFPGGRLQGMLILRPVLEPIGAVRTVLRCVRDQRGAAEAGGEAPLEPTILYQQISEIPIPVEQEKLRTLNLAFTIPPDLPGTDLSQDEATYWQVALRIPVVGPDFEAAFLAPVYGKP
ncbi:MAG TPA: hypothetical protein VH988_12930 [Thermoanaerobaculia bacterium]|jgi:hypothetical protein|nr:hypothetical protein [Thermoanaerobaculia bacterium]